MTHMKDILILASFLFAVGIYGALTRRNTIGILISIELIFNSSCLNFAVFAKMFDSKLLTGEVFVLFIIAIAAAEAAIGLALLLSIYRSYKSIASDRMNLMKG